jgi:hypothetical protein
MARKSQQQDAEPPPHRGRVQAQGGGTEKSVAWSQDSPPTVDDLLRMLDELEAMLTPAERRVREKGFEQARSFLQDTASAKGLDAPTRKSRPIPKVRGGVRVDIEVIAGKVSGRDA